MSARISTIRPIRLMPRCSAWMSPISRAPRRKSKAAVESMVYEDMVVTCIAEKEKLTVSDDEYHEIC